MLKWNRAWRIVLAGAGAGVVLALLLGLLRQPRDLEHAISSLRSADPEVCAAACGRLAQMGASASPAARQLVSLLDDNRVAKSLADRLWDTFSPLGGGSGIGVCTAAGKALVQIGDASVDPLIEALGDRHPRTRANAASVLADLARRGIKPERAVQPLCACLQDGDANVRDRAAQALEAIAGGGNHPCSNR